MEHISPLIGVVLGALISGVGVFLKSWIDKKRIIAVALADLLEVRHHIVSINTVINEVNRRVAIPPEAYPLILGLIEKMAPLDEKSHQRYDSAVSLLAEYDPVLAFRMRSKNTAPQLLETIRQVAATTEGITPNFKELEATLHSTFQPVLNEAVLELAKKHSLKTRFSVKRIIAKSEKIPEEAMQMLDHLQKACQLG